MTSEQLQILDDLATLLESGDLPCKFDYSVYGNGRGKTCGDVAGPEGLLPYLRPDKFRWTGPGARPCGVDGQPYPKVLGLGKEEDDHLFMPELQKLDEYGGRLLTTKATAEEVAANIREFVRRKRANTI